MPPARSSWNWSLLFLLGLSSYATGWAFGFAFPFIDPSTPVTPDSPQPYFPSAYPWTAGLAFTALTVVLFLLCLRDPRQRRAACAAFGLSALLTGPVYVGNAGRLAEITPASSPWTVPHLPPSLTVLCWAASGGLLFWWWLRSIPIRRQGPAPLLLFTGLLAIFLLFPALTNRCGIESLRFFTTLPANADAVRGNKDGLTHLLIHGFAGALGDIVGFLTQWIGLTGSALVLFALAPGLMRSRSKAEDVPPANAFPSRSDIVPTLLLGIGGLLFPTVYSMIAGLKSQMSGVVGTIHHPVYPYQAGLLAVEILTGLFFLAGSWLVFERIRSAPQLRFAFTLLVLIASASVSSLAYAETDHVLKAVGVLAVLLCLGQIVTFFHPKRRAVWTSSAFAAPGEAALNFALQGSVILAVLAGAFMAIAIELALVSVLAIHYLIDWGNALKPLHGVAPTGEIAPAFAPTLPSITIVLGPVYFTACLFVCVLAVLLFSLGYAAGQGCAKFVRRVVKSRRRAAVVPSTLFVRRQTGDPRFAP